MAIEILRRRPVAELQPGKAALRLITSFEGLSLKAYRDSVGILTAGYGHTGPDVTEGMQITLKQADDWLAEDIAEAWDIVRTSVQVPLTQGEADALTSIAFNIGRVPRSMLAALNGGLSDKGEAYSPGSYGSALKQFVRNCRAGGVPLRGLYRRRLAEACVYSDLPFENACSISVVQLEVDASKNIVPSGTTSLEDTLMRARQDVPILRPDATDVMRAPWPQAIDQPIPRQSTEAIPVQLPVPDEDELLLDQPAAPPKADAKGSPSVHPQPVPAAVPSVSKSEPAKPSNSTQAPMSATVEKSAAAPASPPPAPVPPPKPVIIGPQPINPNALPNNADTSKNMADSTRMTGMILVGIGTVVQVVTLRLGVGTAIGAVFFDLTRDPVVITLVVTAIVGGLGWVTKRNGKKTFAKGADKAQGGLY